jgi:hypothetical protein
LSQKILEGKDSRSAQTDAGKKLVAEGLPQDSIAESARTNVVKQYNEEAAESSTRATFIRKWAAAHNDNDKGAVEEYNHFKKLYGLIDSVSGKVNQDALKQMDDYIMKDLNGGRDETLESTPQAAGQLSNEEVIKRFGNASSNDIVSAIKRQKQGK